MHQHRAIQQYLQKYAEPEAETAAQIQWPQNYRYTLLIPAYRESARLIDRLIKIADDCQNLLIILVVNRPDTNTDKTCNQALIQRVHQLKKYESSTIATLTLYSLNPNSDLLCVDRDQCGAPIPIKQGVGLARKIAADIAATLMTKKIVSSHWIHSTDADTLIPKHYFSNLDDIDPRHYAAAVHPYKHISDDNKPISLAMKLYELRLHYYVEGLRYAKSPYAHHTLGSCLSASLIHYCQVRGYPKRSGAEDFYLLNKLRKTGGIFQHQRHQLHIISRLSDRVPFGTGPAVIDLSSSIFPLQEKIFYHPKCFEALKTALDCSLRFFGNVIPKTPAELEAELLKTNNDTELCQLLSAGLFKCNWARALQHCQQQGKNQASFERHFLIWFDGFRTLKLIHYLRDEAYSNIDAIELLESIKRYEFIIDTVIFESLQDICDKSKH